MSGELHPMETRRRSRSRTPFLRSSCDHENCDYTGDEEHSHQQHHHLKKAAAAKPSVQTIVEETVVVTSSSPTPKKASPKQAKAQSNQRSMENAFKASSSSATTNSTSSSSTTTTTTTTTVLRSNKRIEGRDNAIASTSTPKGSGESFFVDSFAAQFSESGTRAKEVTQNEINSAFEKSQQHLEDNHKKADKKKKRSLMSFFSSSQNDEHLVANNNSTSDLDSSDHLAYLEYKRAGEYWKTTPKTDYTYSELSPHRRVLAPGVIAMPNMSRQSLDNHHERVNYMVDRDPAREEYIRRRYEATNYKQQRKETEKLFYDSTDEYDYTYTTATNYNGKRSGQELETASWLWRVLTTIVTSVTSIWSSTSSSSAGKTGVDSVYDNYELYYTRYGGGQVQRGFFGSIGHGISSFISGFFRKIYQFISFILCWETWALQKSVQNRNKRRWIFFISLLLGFLLLGAWYLWNEPNRQYYLQRTQALLPLSLMTTLRASLYTAGAMFRGLFNLPPLKMKNTSSEYPAQLHLPTLEANMQKALTPEEYENILNHVNSYVQQLVHLKMQQQHEQYNAKAQQMTAEHTQLIVQVMRENLERISREKREAEAVPPKLPAFTDDDIERLAVLVREKLLSSKLGFEGGLPVQLTAKNLEEIQQLIRQHIEVNNHAHYQILVERIDLDALLRRILLAPQLAEFIDARINSAVASKLLEVKSVEGSGVDSADSKAFKHQQQLIDELNNEIAFIKLSLSDKISENEDMHQSISKLKLGQDDLLERLQTHELATDKRFSVLLGEIESKLASLKDDQFVLLNKQIKLSLVEILGFKQTGGKFEDVDLQNWVRSMFVAKEYLEERLLQLNDRTNERIKEEIDRSGMILMRDISERLKLEILVSIEAKHAENSAALKGQIRAALSEDEVRRIVKSVLAIYDADKTGLVDFALESSGGQILSTRCTESYQTKSAQISVFGIPLWYPTNTPRVAISPNVQPGECWAFQGFPGFLVLKLNSMVYVTGFTLEHIPKTLSPSGLIESSPRNFTVWGLDHEKDQEPVLFGEYEFVDNEASLQYFPVQNKNIKRPYDIVELRIESNHGHPQYTCLYRFRVHGKPHGA